MIRTTSRRRSARHRWPGRRLLLAGCATGPNPRDPYESFNRKMFAFNDGVDRWR